MNTDFINYYKKILNLSDSDFTDLITSFKSPLPTTFRLTSHPLSHLFISKYKEHTRPVQFFPQTYTLLQNFPLFNTANTQGLIIRQELVSMVPVFLADIQKTDKILDLCAAPGSKTSQILERCDGLVIANDVSPSRINILRSQTNKVRSRCLAITCYDARHFPNILVGGERVLFDKIFCDVPCSGDATYRKNKGDWKVTDFYALQRGILERAVRLVRDGGIIVYSTCSLNPRENEDVIKDIEEVELVECREGMSEYLRNGMRVRRGLGEGMERCVRIYPHDNDTGGFFIAVLRRKARKEIERKENFKSEKKVRNKLYEEVPETVRSWLSKFYEIKEDDHLISTDRLKEISVINGEVLKLLSSNLKIQAVGYKAFKKNFNGETYRGAPVIHRRDGIPISKNQLITLINQDCIETETPGREILFLSFSEFSFNGYKNGRKIFVFWSKELKKLIQDLFITLN